MAHFLANTTIGGYLAYHSGILPDPYNFPSGTKTLFIQTTSPIGWTKLIDNNDCALRVVSGDVSSGGESEFSSVFSTNTISISVGSHTLSESEMASHRHYYTGVIGTGSYLYSQSYGGTGQYSGGFHSAGGSLSHEHSGLASLNMAIKYKDTIIASKD